MAITLGALSVVLTLSGVLKPILWDEEVYFQFAEYISRNPFDPYGVTLKFSGQVARGLHVLAPPLILYWWGGAIALFGSSVSLTSLLLLPFAAAYTASFYCLSRRFAPSLALPLTVMASTSAWALVSFSYMLDFPAAALGLSALALFITGIDANRRGLVVAAGVAAGLALETKYNSVSFIAAIALYGVLSRRPLDTILAITLASGIFAATELAIFLKYGQSHFVLHVRNHSIETNSIGRELLRLRGLLYGLVENGGPLAIGMLLIAPFALGSSRRVVLVNSLFVILAFALSAVGFDHILNFLVPSMAPSDGSAWVPVSAFLGLLWVIQSLRVTGSWLHASMSKWDRDAVFLIAWATAAVVIYFVMSPFPAARRMGEILTASTLIFGRSIASASVVGSQVLLWRAVAINAVCGCVMLSIALIDARNVAMTAHAASVVMRENAAGGGRWHLSSLAMDRYFAADGMQRVEVGRSVLQPGDMLAVDMSAGEQGVEFNADGFDRMAVVREGINLGVRVSTDFYRFQLPWVSRPETRSQVIIYRATRPTRVAFK